MSLGIQAEFLHENAYKLVDVLQLFAPGRVDLPINNAFLELAKVLWSTLALALLTDKCMDKHYFVPDLKGSNHIQPQIP